MIWSPGKPITATLLTWAATLALVGCQPTPSGTPIRISYPSAYAIVAADVPVQLETRHPGRYEVDLSYGEGISPTQWTTITRNTITITPTEAKNHKQIPVIWHTGLTNYQHGPDFPKLVDYHTLRVQIKNARLVTENAVLIQVGNEVPNITGGVIYSKDRVCELWIPSHALSQAFLVGGITAYQPLNLNLPDAARVSLIYEIKPTGISFLKPVQLIFRLTSPPNDATIAGYDDEKKSWILLPTIRSQHQVSAQLQSLPPGEFSFWGVFSLPRKIQPMTSTKPPIFQNITSTHNYVLLRDVPQKLRDNQQLALDYKLMPEHKLALLFRLDKKWFALNLGDDPWFDWPLNARIPGHVERLPPIHVTRDGTWQTLSYPIQSVLAQHTEYPTINEVELANWDSTTYMDWHLGPPFPHVYSLKNIRFTPGLDIRSGRNTAGYLWRIGYPDHSNDEFAHERAAPDDYTLGKPFSSFERAITQDDPLTRIHFEMNHQPATDQRYELGLNVDYWDHDRPVEFSVLLNNRLESRLRVPQDGTLLHCPITNLKLGRNTLTLRWEQGGKWISWDSLEMTAHSVQPQTASGNWTIGYPDYRSDEFGPELNAGDDYELGDAFVRFERAITREDPVSRIHFTLDRASSKTLKIHTAYGDFKSYSRAGFKAEYNIALNGHTIKTIQAPRDSTYVELAINSHQLHAGDNLLTLRWLSGAEGGEYVNWDYIQLQDRPDQ